MSDELLKVKFAWRRSVRSQSSTPIISEPDDQKSRSRNAEYIRKLKTEDHERYQKHKKRDSARKHLTYKAVPELGTEELALQRKKWAQAKRKQRQIKDTTVATVTTEATEGIKKKFKDLNSDEKRVYYRLKRQQSRKKRSSQKVVADRVKDVRRKTEDKRQETTEEQDRRILMQEKSMSKTTSWRKTQQVAKSMPSQPEEYAKVVENLIGGTPATPRKVASMDRKGIRRVKLADDMMVVNIKTYIKKCKAEGVCTSATKQMLYCVIKACMGSDRVGSSILRRYLGITHKMWKRIMMNDNGHIRKKKSSGIIREDVADFVREFWWSPDVSRTLPLKKRVKHGVPLHLLECSYTTAFKRFQAKFPDIKIGYVKFIQLRPGNVRHMRSNERIVCCCIKCENLKLLTSALNNTLPPNNRLPRDEVELCNMTMCTAKGRFPSKACIESRCLECGDDQIGDRLKDVLGDDVKALEVVPYKEWRTVEKTTKSKKGITRTIKVVDCVQAEGSLQEVVKKIKGKVKVVKAHLFRAKWQQEQLKQCKEKIQGRTAVLIMDFAENYTCTSQDEIQSAHWVNQAVTIHPIQAFINGSDDAGVITNKESLIFISDDLRHDADAVAHFKSITYKHLADKYGIVRIDEFSDCCAQQYRCGKSFVDIAMCTGPMRVKHHYFEASHGKNSADGLGATVKHSATMAVTRRQFEIRNAHDFYNFCIKELDIVGTGVFKSQTSKYSSSSRKFFYVSNNQINRDRDLSHDVKSVKGTMTVHCAVGTGTPYQIMIRDLTCTCEYCYNSDGESCGYQEYVGQWKTKPLTRKHVESSKRKSTTTGILFQLNILKRNLFNMCYSLK